MISICEKRNMQNQHLCINEPIEQGSDLPEIRSFRDKMLSHNAIEGLLIFTTRLDEGERICSYDIAGKEAISHLYDKELIDYKSILLIIEGIIGTIEKGREYLLEDEDYVINSNTVYMDETRSKVYIPYYIGYNHDLRRQLEEVSEFLMNRTDYHDQSAVVLIYSIYMQVKEESCTTKEILKMIGERKRALALNHSERRMTDIKQTSRKIEEKNRPDYSSKSKAPTVNNGLTDSYSTIQTKSGVKRKLEKKVVIIALLILFTAIIVFLIILNCNLLISEYTGKPDVKKVVIMLIIIVFVSIYLEIKLFKRYQKRISKTEIQHKDGCKNKIIDFPFKNDDAKEKSVKWEESDTELLYQEKEEETELLYAEPEKPICTLVSDEYETINVSYLPFYIGKDLEHMDCILNQTGISRFHAKLDKIGNRCVISDLNSTNGTYVNGVKLEPHLPEQVKRGDEIVFGRSRYYFN